MSVEEKSKNKKSELLRQMVDLNPVPYFVIDENHHIVHWSKGCEEILGKTAEQMVGTRYQWIPFYPEARRTLADFIIDGEIEEVLQGAYADKQVRRSTSITGAFEAVDFFPKLGKEGLWLHFTAAPILDDSGRLIGAIETLQDVSLQRNQGVELRLANAALEREVAKRTVELAEINRRLSESLSKSEEINHLKSTFLSAISSELKTPLNGILGFASMIKADPNDPAVVEYVKEIQDSGHTLLQLLENVLILSEIAAGQAESPRDQFSPHEIIANSVSAFKAEADRKGLLLNVSSESSCPDYMVGDARRLMHCLQCLLQNALKFTEQGSVKVRISGESDQLLLEVEDTGPGLPSEVVDQINAAPAVLLPEARHAHCGMGLGLALVKAQMAIMQGSLQFIAKPGEGTRFTLRIPLCPVD